MVVIDYSPSFGKTIQKIRDSLLREKVHKQIRRIIESPDVGKPMRHARKGTREVYIPPFRLSYCYIPNENKIIFLDLYHKDEQ